MNTTTTKLNATKKLAITLRLLAASPEELRQILSHLDDSALTKLSLFSQIELMTRTDYRDYYANTGTETKSEG